MADWPETDEAGKHPTEPEENIPGAAEESEQTGKTGRTAGRPGGYLWAFLAGALAMFFVIVVFQVGWIAARRADLRQGANETDADGQEDAGAAVLTDQETLYKLGEIQRLIDEHYLNEVESDELSTYLFKGAAAGLDDPYASYYSIDELQSVLDSNRGEYMGIGITLMMERDTGKHVVAEVYEDSPASEAGLQAGDVLVSVDGTALDGMNLDDVVSMLKSKEGAFSVEIYREETGETLETELVCEEIVLQYVESEMLEDGIAYLSLSEFTELSVTQFREAIQTLKEQGMEKLIVDLRGNPGGLLTAVCDILDEILPESLIVYTEDKNGERQEYYTDDKRTVDCEVAVLVNGRSASASEIFAGAVQDLGIGPVIGAKTYGKGVVQDTYFLSDGSAFKFTTQKYFTPNGQDIDGTGITPDVIVEEADDTFFGPEEDSGNEMKEAGDADGGTNTDAVLEKAVEVLGGQ